LNLIASKDSRSNSIDGLVSTSAILNLNTFLNNFAKQRTGLFNYYYLSCLKHSFSIYFDHLHNSYKQIMRQTNDDYGNRAQWPHMHTMFDKYLVDSNPWDFSNFETNLICWKNSVLSTKTVHDFIVANDLKCQNLNNINEYVRTFDYQYKIDFVAVQVPTLCLLSLCEYIFLILFSGLFLIQILFYCCKADPIINMNSSVENYLPLKFLNRNKESILMLTSHGAHCTFLDSLRNNSEQSWSERVCLDYLFKLQKSKNHFTFF
jgi:hypothetical protein